MTSAYPSPFTSPAEATDQPNQAPGWRPLAVQSGVADGPRAEPRNRKVAWTVQRGPDDDVVVPIAVHVSGRSHRGAERGVPLVALDDPFGGGPRQTQSHFREADNGRGLPHQH